MSTAPQQLGIDYTGCVTSLVIMGKSVCPSCQKQHARRVHLYIRNILGHHFTVRIHCRQYIQWVLYCWLLSSRAVPHHSTRVRGRHGSSGAAPRVFPEDEPTRVEELRRTSALCVDASYERIRPASKINIYVRLFVCLCQLFAHQFNP